MASVACSPNRGCSQAETGEQVGRMTEKSAEGRLQARPVGAATGTAAVGLRALGPGGARVGHRYGPDVAAIDRALEHVFSRCAVDPGRVAVGGYSDGASYALSLGIANGDLFTHVLAFSPGFMALAGQVSSPQIFVSHGTRDGWLPIESCSRRIVPRLEGAGYEVRYGSS